MKFSEFFKMLTRQGPGEKGWSRLPTRRDRWMASQKREMHRVYTHTVVGCCCPRVCVCVCGSRVTWHNKNGIVFSTTQQTHFMLHIYRKDIWPPFARIDRQPTKGSHRLTLKSLLFFILFFPHF
jgi:hypothetical protein